MKAYCDTHTRYVAGCALCQAACRAYQRAWNARNPEKSREHQRRYRAKGAKRRRPASSSTNTPRVRRANGIARKAATRVGARWTPEEDQVLLRDDLTILQMALLLKRTLEATGSRRGWLLRGATYSARRRSRNRGTRDAAVNHRTMWTPEEDAALLTLADSTPMIRVAFLLGRSVQATETRLSSLRLGKKKSKRPASANQNLLWTAEEDAAVLCYDKTATQLAAELGRTYKAVEHRRAFLARRVA